MSDVPQATIETPPVLDGNIIPVFQSKNFDRELFDKVAKSGGWLPRLQHFNDGSDLVKEDKIPIGYAIVRGKDMNEPLGREIDALIIAYRPKALDMRHPKVDADGTPGITTVASYNFSSPLFQAIQAKGKIKNSGAVFGPEFLVYIPQLKEFATLFMCSPTGRNEAPKVLGFVGKPCTLITHLFSNAKHKWKGILAQSCSTPFEPPPFDKMKEVFDAFDNPPMDAVEEVVEDSEVAAAGVDRDI